MKTKPVLVGLGTVLVAALLVVAGGKWGEHTRIAASLPPRPELTGKPTDLVERIDESDAKARDFTGARTALAELSGLYHANGFLAEALQCYAMLREIEPREARWAHLAGSLLASAGRLDEAEPMYRRATELAPDYLPARLRLGDVLLKGNRTTDAAQVYTDVLARWPEQPYALLGLARVAIAGQNWTEARAWLRRSIAADPEFVGGLSLLVTVDERLGENAEAAALRERINHREFVDLEDPWAEALLDDCYDPYYLSVAAAVAVFRGQASVAERWLQRAIALSDSPAPYHRQLGKLYFTDKNYPAARRSFEEATRLAPTDSDAWAMLVNLLLAMSERAQAYQTVARALAHCPESRALHFAYGRMLNEDGRYAQAIGELQEAKRLGPGESNAYVELAQVYFRRGEIEAGLAEMKAALGVQPDHPLALVVLARDSVRQGDRTAAESWIRKMRGAARVRPEDLTLVLAEFRDRFGREAP